MTILHIRFCVEMACIRQSTFVVKMLTAIDLSRSTGTHSQAGVDMSDNLNNRRVLFTQNKSVEH